MGVGVFCWVFGVAVAVVSLRCAISVIGVGFVMFLVLCIVGEGVICCSRHSLCVVLLCLLCGGEVVKPCDRCSCVLLLADVLSIGVWEYFVGH